MEFCPKKIVAVIYYKSSFSRKPAGKKRYQNNKFDYFLE